MRSFPDELGKLGFVFNFITYGGHQIDGLAAEEFTMRPLLFIAAVIFIVAPMGLAQKQSPSSSHQTRAEEVIRKVDNERIQAQIHDLAKPIIYGVTPPGFTTMIQPQKLIPGRVYAAFATDEHGGSSSLTFGFDKNGKITFLDSFDQ